jgi:hypothetical protein
MRRLACEYAELMRIRADYEQRIKAARDARKPELAKELEKQFEVKIIKELAREKSRKGQ